MYQKLLDPITKKELNWIKKIDENVADKNSFIPFDLANRDYQEYLKWLEEGNTPLPAEENN
jgi:hypothetical protein